MNVEVDGKFQYFTARRPPRVDVGRLDTCLKRTGQPSSLSLTALSYNLSHFHPLPAAQPKAELHTTAVC